MSSIKSQPTSLLTVILYCLNNNRKGSQDWKEAVAPPPPINKKDPLSAKRVARKEKMAISLLHCP